MATKALATSPRISFYLMIYEYTQSLDLVKAAVRSPSWAYKRKDVKYIINNNNNKNQLK